MYVLNDAQRCLAPAAAKTTRRLAERFGFRGALQSGVFSRVSWPTPASMTRQTRLIGGPAPLAFALLPVILEGNRSGVYSEAPMGDLPMERIVAALRHAWGVASRPRTLIH